MREVILKLERDRKRAMKVYGEDILLKSLSEKTDYKDLCDIYSKLQLDIENNIHLNEAKWLKTVIEKTILSKIMEENGYYANGKKK